MATKKVIKDKKLLGKYKTLLGKIPFPKGVKFDIKNNPKLIYALIAGVVLAVLFIFRSLFVVAVVNNYPISRFSVIRELEKQGGSQVLDSIISERLIMQEAAKKNVKVSKEDVDKELQVIENNLKSQGTDLETALSIQGQTKEDLNKAISLKLLIEKTLADRIVVDATEIKTYFDNNKATLYKDKLLSQVEAEIKSQLEQQKLSSEYQKWIAEIKAKAKIINFINFDGASSKTK
jgi:hypothetical protein